MELVVREQKSLTDKQREFLARLSGALPPDLKDVDRHSENPLFNRMPTTSELVASTGVKDSGALRAYFSAIEDTFNLPEGESDLVTGEFSELEARARRLVRQYRQRREPDGTLREADKTYLLMGPLGTASRLTDPDVFKGLNVVIGAYGFDNTLVGMVGEDVVPEVGAYWSITTQDKQVLMGKIPPEIQDVLEQRQGLLDEVATVQGETKSGKKDHFRGRFNLEELLQDDRLSDADRAFISHEVEGTINTVEVALEVAAYQLAPLVSALPPDADVVFRWGVKDFYNLRERMRWFVETQAKISAMELKVEEIPKVENQLDDKRRAYAQHEMNVGLGEFIVGRLEGRYKKGRELVGKEFRAYVKDKVLNQDLKGYRQMIDNLRGSYSAARGVQRLDGALEDDFSHALDEAVRRYTRDIVTTDEKVEERLATSRSKRRSSKKSMAVLEDKLGELQELTDRIEREKEMGMAWFTKQYALQPTDAKAMNLIVKKFYSDAYDMFVERLEDLVGRKLNARILKRVQACFELGGNDSINPHLSVFTAASDEDDLAAEAMESGMAQLHAVEYDGDGIPFAFVSAPNFTRSNEPVHGDCAALQGIHEEAVARQVQFGIKPEEFTGVAGAKVVFSAYGAGGWEIQPKMPVMETTINGEYRRTPNEVWFIKGNPMHDMDKLQRAQKHGNKGSWDVKRYSKGGLHPGALFFTFHADGRRVPLLFGSKGLASIGKDVYDRKVALEQRIAGAKSESAKEKARSELEALYASVRVQPELALDVGDGHWGSSNWPGRPNNRDTTLGGTIALLDAYGKPAASIHSEMPHGIMKIRSWAYSSLEEAGARPTAADLPQLSAALFTEMKKGNISEEQLLYLSELYSQELAHWQPVEIPSRQLDMLKKDWVPVVEEMMRSGTRVTYISGNHWNTSVNSSDEAHEMVRLHDQVFRDLGLLHYQDGGFGNSQTTGVVYLPGTSEKAFVAHKMWHGRTETAKLAAQAKGIRLDGRYVTTDDRHHPGVAFSAGKICLLSPGNQTWNPYVPTIGKTGSSRGAAGLLYDAEPEKDVLGCVFAIDNVTDAIVGWDDRADALRYVHQVQDRYAEERAKSDLVLRVKNYAALEHAAQEGKVGLHKGTYQRPPGELALPPPSVPQIEKAYRLPESAEA